MNQLSFTLPEILSLLGLTQCVYLVVHILFQARRMAAAGLPLVFFCVLGTAFFADAMARRIALWENVVYYVQWGAWFFGPPLSVLLVLQMVDLNKWPPFKDFWVLLLLPLSFILSSLTVNTATECALSNPCDDLKELLNVMGLMAGTISLLVIFSKKDLFKSIKKQKHGLERYWLILALIILNTLFLGGIFASMTSAMPNGVDVVLLRTVFGLGFVYLVSTNLLRIFPPEGKTAGGQVASDSLSAAERALAMKIERLLDLDKVYQEPTYARSDLARECNVSEMLVSRVINVHFQKSFPQIMNERRIEDAKRLLSETDAAVKIVSEEVGFNSLPSFNRVFKDLTGESPGQYRKNVSKTT